MFLLLEQFQHMKVPKLPVQCQWGREGLKILGDFFGTDRRMRWNWDGLSEKVLVEAAELGLDLLAAVCL